MKSAVVRINGFTVLEIIIAVVLIGVLATLAVPKIGQSREVVVFAEAKNVLRVMSAAQKRYQFDNAAFTAVCTDLDVPPADTTLVNFNSPACTNTGNVSLARNASGYSYTLTLDIAGAFSCPLCPVFLQKYLN